MLLYVICCCCALQNALLLLLMHPQSEVCLNQNGMNRGVLGDSLFCSCFGGEKKEVKPNWWGFYNLRRCAWGFEWQAVQHIDLMI